MSKAVLVLDMPEGCNKCPLCRYDSIGNRGCSATSNIILLRVGKKKPEWCPLREMPEHEESIAEDYLSANWTDGYKLGWNDCIEAIERNGEDGNV